MKTRKKLIEVALPLDAINKAAAREKSIRHGHPSTLHLWWARRPLAAARAVIFGQIVDDPSSYVEDLLAQPNLKRRAESTLKARLKRWEEATALAGKARTAGTEAPDPGEKPTLEDTVAEIERQRLFKIIEDLVQWENTTNETVLQAARDEIWQSWRRACADNADHPRAKELFDRHKLPAFHDPFAGGGALPLEAQRLGLESHASDLNPVAVLINKAMIEIPPKFAGRPPVNPDARKSKELFAREWKGAQGLAEDVRYYGQWMRDEAEKRIGHLYPKVEVTAAMAKERPDLKPYIGRKLTVIAWLWARTVKSPNPAFAQVDVPLVSSFILATKPGKEAHVDTVLDEGAYRFVVRSGKPRDLERAKTGTKVGRGGNFQCLMSGVPIPVATIREQGLAGTFGSRLMAVVAEGDNGRVYLSPTSEQEEVARAAEPKWIPGQEINYNPRDIRTQLYGLTTYADLFTLRQLVALTTLSDLIEETRERVWRDAVEGGVADDHRSLRDRGTGATGYAEAVSVYLALCASKASDNNSTLCSWMPGLKYEVVRNTFSRQALPMSWDYAESNPFAASSGDFFEQVKRTLSVLELALSAYAPGVSTQCDAQSSEESVARVVSTDPPYYDNIGYADLSDFCYVWLRRSMRRAFPDLFATLAVPKAEELVATPYRHGSKEKAELFFLDGMTHAMHRIAEQAHPNFPVTIYYAFKQSESDDEEGTASTGWDTFLAAVIEAGFALTGTWPMRTERGARSISIGTNALASSIILVCRQRATSAPTATRREFVTALKTDLPLALAYLQRGNIAPVDLAQAAIGPGMAVFTRYSSVLDAEGKPLSVRDALALINQTLDESLAEQEADFDPDTRWALAWFEESGFSDGEFGVADVLARAKVTAVNSLVEAGLVTSGRGKVRLLKPEEMPADWDPATDHRLTAWEMVHHLIRVLEADGEPAAARIAAKLGTKAEVARELCYRLYTICERQKRAEDALRYNGLVQSWPEIVRLAGENPEPQQPSLMGA